MARARTMLVTCPFCRGTLEVNAANGKIVRRFPPRDEAESDDLLADALKKVKEGESRREKMLREAREKEKGKLERIEKAFREKKREIEESGDTGKPIRDIDLD